MVGLVLVSHSRQLAEAVCRLARGVGSADIPVAFSGGAGPDGTDLGTDATEIMEAIRSVDGGGGVVVLMDLGSAVISARMAAELLDGEVAGIRLCPAPLVEGAVAAAVQIAAGADADAVFAEAGSALAAKQREMDDGTETPAPPERDASAPVPDDALRLSFVIADPNGMHARPASRLAVTLGRFDAEVRLRNGSSRTPFINARSLNQIALSNIRRGDVSELAAWGPQAAEAVAAVRTLVTGELQGREVDAASVPLSDPVPPAPPVALKTLSPGMAEGALFIYDTLPILQPRAVSDPAAEAARLDAAVDAARAGMEASLKSSGESGKYADILQAQQIILDDPEILDEVRRTILRTSRDAASTYQSAMTALAASYRAMKDNPLLRERAADVEGVAEAVLRRLLDRPAAALPADGAGGMRDVVLWGRELSPAQLGGWEPGRIKGILSATGGGTSHVAILARELGIPAIVGYAVPEGAATGDAVVLDANRLEVSVKPSAAELERFRARRSEWLDAVARDRRDGRGLAASRDGVSASVLANAGSAAAAAEAALNGADGIGLLRTEFLFLDRLSPPTEDEQVEEMSAIMKIFPGKPVTVRTLDAGGDKPMPWLDLPPEENPFLGVRGVRVSMRRPDVFRTQIRAILRAGAECDLSIMVPMVDSANEVRFFLGVVDACRRELSDEGVAHAWPVKRGIMVETPAAVLQASLLAPMVDFFSIGSNDLTQYVMCAERGSKDLAEYSDSLAAPVLRMIGMVRAAAGDGPKVSVCGEMAADPASVRALLGLGVTHFSVSAAAVGPIKRTIRGSEVSLLRPLAEKLLSLESARDVRRALS